MAFVESLPAELAHRLIVCAGVYRSGSTWAYNMVKAIVGAAKPSAKVAGRFAENIDELALSGTEQSDFIVLKTHPQPALLALIEYLNPPIVLSVRDPRDCVASWLEMLDETFEEFQPRLMRSCAAALELARHARTLTIRYEDGATKNAGTVRSIAEHLGLKIDEHSSDELVARLSADSVKEKIKALASTGKLDPSRRLIGDPQTLWLPAHVGDGRTGKYHEKLSADQIRSVNYWARGYCDAFNYEVPAPAAISRGRTVLNFGRHSDALMYLRSGFSYPEDGFTWSDGDVAIIKLTLAQPIENQLHCEFRYFTPRPPNAPPVKLVAMLLCGGRIVASAVDSGNGPQLRLEFADPRLNGQQELIFRIAVIDPYSPKAHNNTNDDRKLGMALQSLALTY